MVFETLGEFVTADKIVMESGELPPSIPSSARRSLDSLPWSLDNQVDRWRRSNADRGWPSAGQSHSCGMLQRAF